MSNFATTWAWKYPDLTPVQRCVLMALANFHTELYGCFPSINRIVDHIKVPRSSVCKALAELVEIGAISRKQQRREDGGQTSSRYFLKMAAIQPPVCPPEEDFDDLRVVVAHSDHPEEGGVHTLDGGSPSVGRGSPYPGHKLSKITIDNKSISPAPPKQAEDGFEEFWDTYPRRIGKEAARKAYSKALRAADRVTLLKSAKAFSGLRKGQDEKFTPHPATWLNQGRWDDEDLKKAQLVVDNLAKAGMMPSRNFV